MTRIAASLPSFAKTAMLSISLTGCGGAEIFLAADVLSAAVKAGVEYQEQNKPTPDEAFQLARIELLRDRGRRGDVDAQFALATYFQSVEDGEAEHWMCSAANAGHIRAQVYFGHWYNEDRLNEDLWPYIRVTPDNREAFVWYSLAADKSDLQAPFYLSQLANAGLAGNALLEARSRLAAWKPTPCGAPVSNQSQKSKLPD